MKTFTPLTDHLSLSKAKYINLYTNTPTQSIIFSYIPTYQYSHLTNIVVHESRAYTGVPMHTGGTNTKNIPSERPCIHSGQRSLHACPRLEVGLYSGSRRECGSPHPTPVPVVPGDVSTRMRTAHATLPGWLYIEWVLADCTSLLICSDSTRWCSSVS